MNVGLSTLLNIGSNYAVKLNEEELLVYEKDERGEKKNSSIEKDLQKSEQKKKTDEARKTSSEELSEDEERLVKDLQSRDAEVKAHESAHQAAGAGMTGAASFTYQQGPDGKMYAIGGEVSISMPTGSTPEETIANARKIVAAAMAPGDPSPQDYSVASSARVMEMKAQQQLAKRQQEEMLGQETYKSESDSLSSSKESEEEHYNISA